jgi:hypothetical protein
VRVGMVEHRTARFECHHSNHHLIAY